MARHAALYGSLAFGLGFLFGALREMLLKPMLGARAAEVAEFTLVTVLVALLGMRLAQSWSNRVPARLVRGVSGVAVLLAMESTFALAVLGMPLDTYLESFDITEGALFPFGLVVMALAPLGGAGER